MEFAWVALNYLGVERTSTDGEVKTVANIHLAYMPWSHSVAIPLIGALLVWLMADKMFGRKTFGLALGLGIISHLVLDLLTHNRDIVPWPGRSSPAFGLGLYGTAVIVIGNFANLSLFSSTITGPEAWLAGHPLAIVSLVFAQIVVTLGCVRVFARPRVAKASPV
jgi:hypothetical protein